jgi:hypothetical protein
VTKPIQITRTLQYRISFGASIPFSKTAPMEQVIASARSAYSRTFYFCLLLLWIFHYYADFSGGEPGHYHLALGTTVRPR